MGGNEVKKHPFYSKFPRSRTAMRNSEIKTVRKLKSCKKTKGLAGSENTMNHGHHLGQTMISSGSTFFCYSLSSTGIAT